MQYRYDSDKTHTLIQNGHCVSVYCTHVKTPMNFWLDKIEKYINNNSPQDKKVILLLIDDGSEFSKSIIEKYKDHPTKDSIVYTLDWSKGNTARSELFKEMIDSSKLAICIHNGLDKSERIFLSMVDPFDCALYVICNARPAQ